VAALCRQYWYPVYALVRRKERDPEVAFDLTQGFFARLLEKNDIAAADPARGRFRNFLCASALHYLSNARKHARAQKRGSGAPPLSLDRHDAELRFARELRDDLSAEALYERRFALEVLVRALDGVRAEYQRAGKAHVFEALKGFLDGSEARPYAEIAARLEASPGAVKVAIHRLRKRLRESLRATVAETVADSSQVDDELRELIALLQTN
jgi:RNA polymerase sigma-70 factor (ECF subfamily)